MCAAASSPATPWIILNTETAVPISQKVRSGPRGMRGSKTKRISSSSLSQRYLKSRLRIEA